ncbi:MAG: regulatory protein RecX [Steroidobacteraceae bacterium]
MVTRRTRPERPERPTRHERAERPARPERPARAVAVALLARRDLPASKLRESLEQRGFSPALIAATLEELRAEHALDDARYARNYVAYHASRGHGPVRIAAELRSLGLPAELIETALEAGPDWSALARQVRGRRFGPGEPGSWAERGRQARFLQYRGFSADHIRTALGRDCIPED